MKKKNVLAVLMMAGTLGMTACGSTQLELVSERVEVELGGTLDENVTSYVTLDEETAKEASLDLSAVDVTKTGTYQASVTYKEQTTAFEVVVEDTTAPEVLVSDKVTVSAGMPLSAKDVLTEVKELSGEVIVTLEKTETEGPEGTEAVFSETESAETIETLAGTEMPMEETETFLIGDVICTNDTVLFERTGMYDVLLTVADAAGNETEVTVPVTVGKAPEFSGIEDFTLTIGAEGMDYLKGVSAEDYNGNDITDKIVCDSSNVKTDVAGTYEITYTVADADGFTAEQTALVTVAEKKAEKNTGKNTSGNKTGNTANVGSAENNGNTANHANAGGAGSADNTGNADNSGIAGNAGSVGNSGGTGGTSTDAGNGGNTDNAGGADQDGATVPDNSGSADAGNNGGTVTPPEGSVIDPNTGMSVPEDFEDDFAGMDVGGADDGSGLSGGSSTWH